MDSGFRRDSFRRNSETKPSICALKNRSNSVARCVGEGSRSIRLRSFVLRQRKASFFMAAATESGNSEATSSGFRAQLNGAALSDLVQLECYARSTRTVRVTSGNGVGYFFFKNG